MGFIEKTIYSGNYNFDRKNKLSCAGKLPANCNYRRGKVIFKLERNVRGWSKGQMHGH